MIQKNKINFKILTNFSLFLLIGLFFGGTLTAAVLVDNNVNGTVEFASMDETVIADEQLGEFILPEDGNENKNKFTTYVHAQNQPTFDGAFNEQMVAGIADFRGITDPSEWKKIQVYISQNSQSNSFQGQYLSMANDGYKIATVGGFDHIPAIANSLTDNQLQNFGWILMDESFKSNKVASALFKGEQSGFLSGVATALYLNLHYNTYQSGGLQVATYGGRPFDPVVAFLGGFQQGIEYWNNHLINQDLNLEHQEAVGFIDLGDFDSFFVGGFESDKAIAITERMLNLGADAIFPVAGVQTREVVRVINQRSEPAIVIGVDTAMEDNNTFQQLNVVTGLPTIPFSAVKDFRKMTQFIIENIFERNPGINPENGTAGLGWINVGDINNNLVSVSSNGLNLLNNYLSTLQIQELYLAAEATKNIFKF